jgi:hypothetical protein
MRPGRLGSIARIVALAAGLVALAALTVMVGFVVQHRDATPVTVTAAQAEFDRLRARFAGQTALVDMQTRSSRSPATAAGGRPLRAFHAVIFDRRGGDRLVQVSVPYWLGRKYARHDGSYAWLGELTFLDDTEFDAEPLRLSIDEIERRGPGLLVDYRHPGGGQFVSWVE